MHLSMRWVQPCGTDPANPDSDGDGAIDLEEVEFGTDPNEFHSLNGTLEYEMSDERQYCDRKCAIAGTPYTGACEGCTWAYNISKSAVWGEGGRDDWIYEWGPWEYRLSVDSCSESDIRFRLARFPHKQFVAYLRSAVARHAFDRMREGDVIYYVD
jgi:hypothetical protein